MRTSALTTFCQTTRHTSQKRVIFRKFLILAETSHRILDMEGSFPYHPKCCHLISPACRSEKPGFVGEAELLRCNNFFLFGLKSSQMNLTLSPNLRVSDDSLLLLLLSSSLLLILLQIGFTQWQW
jgi:hypothetical protein